MPGTHATGGWAGVERVSAVRQTTGSTAAVSHSASYRERTELTRSCPQVLLSGGE